MNILVVNGSPKGKYSITLQTCKFIELMFPEHKFTVLDVGQKIKTIEKDFSKAKEMLENAELIIFSYPVYTFIAPCQLHRFIELIKESGVELTGKYATQITTSKHFYDVTAHRYVEENCYDLGVNYIKGLSADMDDLTKEKGRKEATLFFEHVLWSIEKGYFEIPAEKVLLHESVMATVPSMNYTEKSGDVVILTDASEKDLSLNSMIERFRVISSRKTRIVNINDFNMKGGCLGCLKCAVSGECVYKDGFSEILRNDIQKADAIIFAFTIKDHSMGSLFKMYDDRQFCNGHRSVTTGMPVGYLVSGQLSNETNLKMVIDGRSEVGGNYLCGIATDERDPDYEIDRLCDVLDFALDNKFTQPSNFLGVGGMKIFRDLVYQMRGIMKADHKFYKEHKQYDFPQKHKVMSTAMYLVGAMLSSEKMISKMGNKMNEGMLMPYKKLLDDLDKKR